MNKIKYDKKFEKLVLSKNRDDIEDFVDFAFNMNTRAEDAFSMGMELGGIMVNNNENIFVVYGTSYRDTMYFNGNLKDLTAKIKKLP